MPNDRYLTAKEAAEMLDISMSTLYAYVSRGLIRSEAASPGSRHRRYSMEDIEKLLARKEGRRNPEKLAQDALHWGAPVLDSAITLIDNGRLYYRGQDALLLAKQHTIEQVASLIWTGTTHEAERIFENITQVDVLKYENMLVNMDVGGAQLSALESLQAVLPIAAADDLGAYDLRPAAAVQTGARILRLMAAVITDEMPGKESIAALLQKQWCPDDPQAVGILNAALILCADHELNASSFAARVVASTSATPYAVVIAGLAALQGVKHGGHTDRVEAFLNEITSPTNVRAVIGDRLRRGEEIPGFGHQLYPEGDPRAAYLMDRLAREYPDSPHIMISQAILSEMRLSLEQEPTLDLSLVTLRRVLDLPPGSGLALFALGRAVGWIGHAIEQYGMDRLIRPRARYIGDPPE